MSRFSVYLVVFFVSINAGAGLLMHAPAGGESVAEQLEISPEVESENVEGAIKSANETAPGSGSSSVVGIELFAALGGALQNLLNAAPAFAILHNVGVPVYLTAPATTIVGVIVAFDVLRFVRGGGL